MQSQEKSFEDILQFLMKQQKEEEKIRQEWSKIGIHGYNPFTLRDTRTQQLLNRDLYGDGTVNRLPSSFSYSYNSLTDGKSGIPDYELQKIYLPLPERPVTLSTANYNRMNQGLSSSAVVWIAAILVMGIVVLLIRATEKCLERRIFKVARRTSEEWPTPSVIATSQQLANGDLGNTLRVDIPAFQVDNQDLPPPYTDCTNVAVPNNIDLKYLEEPPPPYAACFVAYTDPKDGEPSAHIVTDLQKAGTSGSDGNIGNVGLTTVDLGTDLDGNVNARVDVAINMDENNERQPVA